MVVYDSGDSDHLIQVMTANLKSAKEIFNQLVKGSAHLIEVIESGTLSGAAYEAGKELFVAYIHPMLQKLAQAISDIESDLQAYRGADGLVRQYDSHLDDALIHQQLNNTKELIRLVQQKIEDDQNFVQDFMNGGFEGVANALGELPTLYEQLDNLEQVKTMYEQELAALEAFVSSTSPLFTDSSQAFNYAMQGVAIINQSTANFDGTINFPAGANMSWLANLEGEEFGSNLLDEQKRRAVLSSLDTSGMSSEEAVTYKKQVSEALDHLDNKGWTKKGEVDYVKYLNSEYSRYMGLYESVYFPNLISYVPQAAQLVIATSLSVIDNIARLRVDKTAYQNDEHFPSVSGVGGTTEWRVTNPDGSSYNSAMLTFFGEDIPNWKPNSTTNYTVRVRATAGQAGIGGTPYVYYLFKDGEYDETATKDFAAQGSSVTAPTYIVNSQIDKNLSAGDKAILATIHFLNPFDQTMQKALNPTEWKDMPATFTQEAFMYVALNAFPEIAGQLRAAKSLEEAQAIIEKADGFGLLDELSQLGEKYTEGNIVMITKTPEGKLMWLETGDNFSGYKHILQGKADDFERRGISKSEIPEVLDKVLKTEPYKIGEGANGPFADYTFDGKNYRVAYGTNGYVVSFFPI